VRVFRQTFILEDASEFHAVAPLEASIPATNDIPLGCSLILLLLPVDTIHSVQTLKVANSWNPYWGEKGYFRIIRGDAKGNGGIEDGVTGSPASAKWSHGR
jgi:hypothetical protein